jgi:DNA-binding transcriptional MerR regulator
MTRLDPLANAEPVSSSSYRIGIVARYVGVSTHALRAWERRYGTVDPRRTPGGSRVYDATEIERLKTLKQLTDHGHPISGVARLSLEELKRLLAESLERSQSE